MRSGVVKRGERNQAVRLRNDEFQVATGGTSGRIGPGGQPPTQPFGRNHQGVVTGINFADGVTGAVEGQADHVVGRRSVRVHDEPVSEASHVTVQLHRIAGNQREGGVAQRGAGAAGQGRHGAGGPVGVVVEGVHRDVRKVQLPRVDAVGDGDAKAGGRGSHEITPGTVLIDAVIGHFRRHRVDGGVGIVAVGVVGNVTGGRNAVARHHFRHGGITEAVAVTVVVEGGAEAFVDVTVAVVVDAVAHFRDNGVDRAGTVVAIGANVGIGEDLRVHAGLVKATDVPAVTSNGIHGVDVGEVARHNRVVVAVDIEAEQLSVVGTVAIGVANNLAECRHIIGDGITRHAGSGARGVITIREFLQRRVAGRGVAADVEGEKRERGQGQVAEVHEDLQRLNQVPKVSTTQNLC